MLARLKAEREARGLSRSVLARKADMSEIAYCKVERGIMPAYPKYRQAIAQALEWRGDPAELFKDDKETNDV